MPEANNSSTAVHPTEPYTRMEVLSEISGPVSLEELFSLLSKAVSYPTESQSEEGRPHILSYFNEFLEPLLQQSGFSTSLLDNPVRTDLPILVAERHESEDLPTVLFYGHSDVTMGEGGPWEPWTLNRNDGKWTGRGSADNKGQHLILLQTAAKLILKTGQLGFNLKVLIESGEEVGSPGLEEFIRVNKDRLKADLFIGSDGPRVSEHQPTVVLGSRGNINFELKVELREGARHSGNWGGILRDPGIILANAIAQISTADGRLRTPGLKPATLNEERNQELKAVSVDGADENWGEPGMSPAEKLFGWNNFAVLALDLGVPSNPINAIQPKASAVCQMRYVKGLPEDGVLEIIRKHLDQTGFEDVEIIVRPETRFRATSTDGGNKWVKIIVDSIHQSTNKQVAVIPNLGGSLPNYGFSEELGLPTIWIPHSYPACQQHAVGEHMLEAIAVESLRIMAGVLWDIRAQSKGVTDCEL